MFKSTVMGAMALSFSFAPMAQADLSSDVARSLHLAGERHAAPPAGHQGQWWTHPRGCEYSRAGRPGETVWYLIINTAKRGCPSYIVGHSSYGDVY
ncbi:MAG: hypothetical protein AAFW87_04975 [Pseudomonadota bacterium]